MSAVKHLGVRMFFGGNYYVIPPLSLRMITVHRLTIASMERDLASQDETKQASAIESLFDVGVIALKRNYPDFTRDILEESLDIGNSSEFYKALMDASGLIRKNQDAEGKMVPGI